MKGRREMAERGPAEGERKDPPGGRQYGWTNSGGDRMVLTSDRQRTHVSNRGIGLTSTEPLCRSESVSESSSITVG